ncbi:MAG: CIA30 family protein [Gammaproteobacteria bacterium]|nr:CIA30 family protein [Gammaproteobacteria bacterium]MDC0188635.1 CIA30 family protein [Gammaproteobacteria bacterium]|tara:strand:+ start:108 stop:644 length:537 start_codon:yes stop_codon:yes gene_type:complete
MKKLLIISLILFLNTANASMIIDNLENSKNRNWVYFTDTVMGGVSQGKLAFMNENGENFYRMTGNVSTENNGGFIQFATGIEKIDKNFEGIKLRVRGNNENYQLHLRTKYTPAPWQYYSAEFNVTNEWKEVIIPFTTFKKSNFYQPGKFKSSNIKSIGIVAIGKDFEAEIDLGRIELY